MKPDDDLVFKALADATRRLLLDMLFARDGQTVDRILGSFEFVSPEGAFHSHHLMASQNRPPVERLSAAIEISAGN